MAKPKVKPLPKKIRSKRYERIERATPPKRGHCTCFPSVYYEGSLLGRRVHDEWEVCATKGKAIDKLASRKKG